MNKKQGLCKHEMLPLLDKMISKMAAGKLLLPSGKRHSVGSVRNYRYLRSNLYGFAQKTGFVLRVMPVKKITQRVLTSEKNYWKKFYRGFTSYLYTDLDAYDNAVGNQMKLLRSFFKYLEKDILLDPGPFYKEFYVRTEQIPVIALTPEQLHFLIYDKPFDDKLCYRLKKVKDIFVFGCTTALRYSDLMRLSKANLMYTESNCYLKVQSQKSKTFTRVRLPEYAVEVIQRYKRKMPTLVPRLSNHNLNKYIKELAELAGWTEPVQKFREKQGKPKEVKKGQKAYRFCDLVSTHTMRRTGITTMLTLGVPEHIVRSISGHAPGSKEFFKYVAIAQTYKDRELEQMHERLKNKFPVAEKMQILA